MTQRKLEWCEKREDGNVWRQAKVRLAWSRNGNLTFEHQGKRYVLKNLLEGTEIIVYEAGQWTAAGHVDHYGTLFLGLGETYSETIMQQNRGKTAEQLISELHNFMNPAPGVSLT